MGASPRMLTKLQLNQQMGMLRAMQDLTPIQMYSNRMIRFKLMQNHRRQTMPMRLLNQLGWVCYVWYFLSIICLIKDKKNENIDFFIFFHLLFTYNKYMKEFFFSSCVIVTFCVDVCVVVCCWDSQCICCVRWVLWMTNAVL